MIILSNCLTDVADEGCLKVANSLVKRLKEKSSGHYIVSYERKSNISHEHLKLNKFLLNKKLFSLIGKRKEKVLYLPFPSKAAATSMRVFVLSLFARFGLEVVVTMQSEIDFVSKILLKISRAKFVLLSRDSFERFKSFAGEKRVTYLKTGVDTNKFVPVSKEASRELKVKYGLDPEKPVVLHVGHLNRGRNIGELMKLDSQFQVVIVVSTLTKNEQDIKLRNQLMSCRNIRIIDCYIPQIQEIYQLSDVYLFPVIEYGKCIDVPLSCMEAAACNKPIVTTRYGEMKEFENREGFFFIDSFDSENLNKKVQEALELSGVNTRKAVLDYDWDNAVSYFDSREKK